eukprot:jgi/Mesvir1/20338/Mv19927-RA.1
MEELESPRRENESLRSEFVTLRKAFHALGERGLSTKTHASELQQQHHIGLSERGHLLGELTTLKSQLAGAERQLASDSSRMGGSHTTSCAILMELQGATHRAHSALNLLSNKVVSTLRAVSECHQADLKIPYYCPLLAAQCPLARFEAKRALRG